MTTKTVTLLRAFRRHVNARDDDQYDGVEVNVVLSHLKHPIVVPARLTDAEALTLAQELIAAVRAGMS